MKTVVLWEPGFPSIDTKPVRQTAIRKALAGHKTIFTGVDALAGTLAGNPDLLVLPYGSAFPKTAWQEIVGYLKRGGRWVNLGGAPLTRPVRKEKDGWHAEVHQPDYGKVCMIRHVWPIDLPKGAMPSVAYHERGMEGLDKLCSSLAELEPERLWSLQVMLTEEGSALFSGASGSSGVRNAVLRPVVELPDPAGAQPLGAAVAVIDSQQGPFMGGRWVLAACSTRRPFDEAFIRAACGLAVQPAVRLEVRPGYGCYYEGERPVVNIRTIGPDNLDLLVEYEVSEQRSGRSIVKSERDISCRASGVHISTSPVKVARPGLYEVRAVARAAKGGALLAAADSGFWLYDEAFMSSAEPLTLDRDYMRKGGKPFPATGTTYMSTEVHRNWMFEPTPMAWDRDFAAMKQAGVNIVRTGFWMGWERMMPEPGTLDEGVVRSVQAFLLTARKYDIPVILNLFAFVPHAWNRGNAYIERASIAAQTAFIAALSQRLAPANHLLWDLINEPSYADPKALWSFRPSGDAAEAEAWQDWLKQQGVDDEEWRERWRLQPQDGLGAPGPGDMSYWHNQRSGSHPLKLSDFVLFAQEAFARWAGALRDVIRRNGNPHQWVMVGQDESGMGRSPGTHFHADRVDMTTNHPWWQNDDSLFSSSATKTLLCPNLMQEVGVMFAESVCGLPQRSPERMRDILERKLVLSFACGCAGFIQWLWNTAVYNPSDNEVGIGLLREDGSAKPELGVLSRIAAFMQRNAGRMEGRQKERVAVVLPHSNIFSVSDTGSGSVRRSVRVLEYHLGLPCRTVSEVHAEQVEDAALIVLPGPRVLREECWQELLGRVRKGSTLLVTGYIEDDPWRRHVARLAAFELSTRPVEVAHEEIMPMPNDGKDMRVTFSPSLAIEKAVAENGSALPLEIIAHGRGRIVYCPIPVEQAQAEEQASAVYRLAADEAGLDSCCAVPGAGMLMHPVIYRDAILLLAVNETSLDQAAVLRSPDGKGWRRNVHVPAGRSAMFFFDRGRGSLIDSCGTGTSETGF